MFKEERKGVVLFGVLALMVVLIILSAALLSRSVAETRIAEVEKRNLQAFWAAEAGIDAALGYIRGSGSSYPYGVTNQPCGECGYDYGIVSLSASQWEITATGWVENATNVLQAVATKSTPANFYDNAIYSAGDVDPNGLAYSVTGDVYYADTITNTNNVTGTITHDPSITPLALLDFQQLYELSEGQGNVYDESRLKDVQKGDDSFPASFWYSEPTDPEDPATGTPNIVYVEGDLELKGNVGTVGGFFVVAGDVITNPSAVYDATINGNGQIDGVVYTRGEFRINGGGGGLNVNGGVWAGGLARLNGNAHIIYNEDYMRAIDALDIDSEAQITFWQDLRNL